MIEHLRRQFLRPVDAGGLPLGMIEAGRGLHQRVEAAALGPWSAVAVGRQRYVDDAGADLSGNVRRKAERSDRPRPIALREDIRLREQIAQDAPPLFALELDETCELAAPGIDGEPGN